MFYLEPQDKISSQIKERISVLLLLKTRKAIEKKSMNLFPKGASLKVLPFYILK